MGKHETMPFVNEASLSEDHKRLLEWLHEAENSTPETDWREIGQEDYRFYAGDQDSTEVKAILEEQNRPATVFNEVKPKVDMLIGMAAQTKFQPDIVPVGKEDEPMAEIMKGVLQHYSRKTKLVKRQVECFEHTVKSGRSLLYYYIDAENPFKPKIQVKRIPGSNFIVDPQAIEYDLSDARYLFIDKWMTEEDLLALWPQVDVHQVRSHVGSGYPLFFNEQDDMFRVVECWHRKYVPMRWFINPLTGKEESLPPKEFDEMSKLLSEGIPMEDGSTQPLPPPDYIETQVRKMHYMLFTDIFEIEGGISPYNWEGFPAALFGAYKNDNTNAWFGAITMMKDPQVALNTMRRQLSHLLQTLPKGLLKHEVGSILNIDEYERRSSDPSFHLEVAAGKYEKVGFEKQPPISHIYQQYDATMGQSMKDASGIQDDLMGIQKTSREPGVTVQMRQQTGMAVLYLLFDNFRESRLLGTKILLSFIQQYVTAPEMIRIKGPKGMELLEINSQMNPESEGFNDVSKGEYDLEVDETVENSTLRMTIAQILTEFSQNNPGAIPPGIILEYANLPYTVKQEVQQAWEAHAQQEQDNIEADRALKMMEIAIKANVEVEKIVASVEAAKQGGRKDDSGK